jgi:hypothetical protein
VSGASDILDPVEAAQDDITRSKRLIASTLDDLTQHHSWLESYHRDERRRAERLKRQEALERLELKRQRAAWMARRFAATSMAVTRATAEVSARNGSAFVAWATPRAHALWLLLLKSTSASLSWTWRTARSLAERGLAASAIAFAWTVHTSDSVGIAFRKRLSTGFAWLNANAAIVAAPALRRASMGWTRTRYRSKRLATTMTDRAIGNWSRAQTHLSRWIAVEAPKLGRDLAAGAATTSMRAQSLALGALRSTVDSGSRTALRTWQTIQKDAWTDRRPSLQHRALIVRQTTALVCVQPLRTRLPVVRTV